jgi:hypothetical protein
MNPSFHIADMKPFWSHPIFTLTVSSLILLSAPPTSTNSDYDGEPATKLASTSFCYLDKEFEVCKGKEVSDCGLYRDAVVCFPNTDSSSNSSRSSKSTVEGTCVSCTDLKSELTKGKLKDEKTIGYLMDTCEPKKRRGPNSAPKLEPNADKNTTKEVRWLRWFLESSYVFEKKKAGDKCNERPRLSRARSYLHRLMKNHFNGSREDYRISLTTPGGKDGDEIAYEGVRAQLDKHRDWWDEKLDGIWERLSTFRDFYVCSIEEELVCRDYYGRCVDCGDERVKKNEDLMEACHPDEEGHERKKKKEGTSTSSTEDSYYSHTHRHDNRNKGSTHETTTEEKDDFAGVGDGTKRMSSELTVILLVIVCSIHFFQ